MQPLDGRGGLVCEDLDQIGTCLVTGRLEGIIVELLDTVANLKIDLSSGKSAVDARGSFGRVATEEVWAVLVSTLPADEFSYCSCRVAARFHRSGILCELHSGQRLEHMLASFNAPRVCLSAYGLHQQQSHEGQAF